MKTLTFTIVKVCLWAFALAQVRHTDSQNSGLIFDITESVNGLLGEKTSVGGFQKEVNEFFMNLASSKNTSPAFFCEIESETFEIFATQIGQIAHALHETSKNRIIQLVVSWTIDITSEQDLSTRLNTSFEIETARFPNIRLNIVSNLHGKTKCVDLLPDGYPNGTLSVSSLKLFRKLVLTISQLQNVRVGIGCGQTLLSCDSGTFENLIEGTEPKFSMYNINFEETNGVTESLTLFKREVNFWDLKSKNGGFKTKEVIYRPIPGSIGDIVHQRLLIKYSEILITVKNHHASIILPIPPEQNDKLSERQHFQVIPHLNAIIWGEGFKTPWIDWVPIVLEATSKGFNTFLLTHYQWSSLKAAEKLEIYKKHQPHSGKSPLKIIMDLSSEKTRCAESNYDCGSINLTQIEADVSYQDSFNTSQPVPFTGLEAFLFEIEINSTGQYKPLIDVSFARKMSSKITVGCSFQQKTFSSVNATKCVEACKTINGSLYALKWSIDLELSQGSKTFTPHIQNLFYYQKSLKKELIKIKQIRDEIQREDPKSTVYFHVYPTPVNKYGDGKTYFII